jgi:hypothetical protein
MEYKQVSEKIRLVSEKEYKRFTREVINSKLRYQNATNISGCSFPCLRSSRVHFKGDYQYSNICWTRFIRCIVLFNMFGNNLIRQMHAQSQA